MRNQRIEEVKEWFKDHKARLKDENILIFRNPKCFSYAMHYVIYGNRLFVTGDLIDAVFTWSDQLTFKWLSDLNLDYFQSKCRCADQSDCGMVWDSDAATFNLRKRCSDSIYDVSDNPKTRPEDITFVEEFDICEALYSQGSWSAYLSQNSEIEFEIKNKPYVYNFEACDDWNIGLVIGNCMIGAWIGLKLAIDDLNKNALSIAFAKDPKTGEISTVYTGYCF